MTSLAAHGGSGRLSRAAGRYVAARGGSRRAAQSAGAGRSATGVLGGFLSNVARSGVADTVRDLGLRGLIGRPVSEVFAAILNSLAPAGATNEEAVARRAINDVLSELFERYGVVDGGLECLDQMDSAAVGEAVEKSVCAFVFERWLLELGKKIEEGAYSDREACRLERDVRAFVRDLVHIDLGGKDPITIDWNGAEGQTLCTRIYQEAYRLIGGEQ